MGVTWPEQAAAARMARRIAEAEGRGALAPVQMLEASCAPNVRLAATQSSWASK